MRFLKHVYEKAITYKTKDTTIILPSQRACVYMIEEFKKSGKTGFLPDIITMDRFVQKMSGLQTEDPINTALYAYKIYCRHLEDIKDFNAFIPVFSMMQNDFNDIDMYGVEFDSLNSLEDIAGLEYKKGIYAERYFNVMGVFRHIYRELNEELKSRGTGYRGIIYKAALNRINEIEVPGNIIFAGFNILTPVEREIVDILIKKSHVDILFSIPEILLKNKHEAAFFINEYMTKWRKNAANIECSTNEKINIYEYSMPTDQVKILEEVFESENGAVVLCDESLMIPAVNGIPAHIKKINITMGYPIQLTPAFRFYKSIMRLHINKTNSGFHRKDIIDLIENRYMIDLLRGKKQAVRGRLNNIKDIYIDSESLFSEIINVQEIGNLFNWYDDTGNLLPPTEIIDKLISIYQESGETYTNDKKDNDQLKESILIKMVTVFNRLITVFSEEKDIIRHNSVGNLDSLITGILTDMNIPFSGDPLQDFQIMGLLETRCLNFDRVVIMSVNEGIIPKGKNTNSFIPFEARETWRLPTYRDNDKLFSYYFYNLILSSKETYITYANSGDENYTERSRFIEQLEWESREDGIFKTYNFSPVFDITSAGNIKGINEIKKTEEMIDILKGGSFSYSGISSYIRNPIDYYMNYVLGIREENEIDEIGYKEIGTAAHDVLEELLKTQIGNIYDGSSIRLNELHIDELIDADFKKMNIMDSSKGKPFIMKRAIREMVKNFLEKDIERSKGKTTLLELENKMTASYELANDKLNLFGRFDRIEEVDDRVMIMDYKTGTVEKRELRIDMDEDFEQKPIIDIAEWKDKLNQDKKFQLLFYGYVACRQEGWENRKLNMGIYSLRNPSEVFYLTDMNGDPIVYTKGSVIDNAFESVMKGIITEMLDINIPFKHIERGEWG